MDGAIRSAEHSKAQGSSEQCSFEENFFKLIVNSAFGKLCECKRNRIRINMVRDEQEALKWTSRPELKTFQSLADDLARVSLNQTEILQCKPTIVGACILDLSKKFMNEFQYKTMKQNFDCKQLYFDTDSFVCGVQTEDFFADLESKQLKQLFDFSNFPKNHPQ